MGGRRGDLDSDEVDARVYDGATSEAIELRGRGIECNIADLDGLDHHKEEAARTKVWPRQHIEARDGASSRVDAEEQGAAHVAQTDTNGAWQSVLIEQLIDH